MAVDCGERLHSPYVRVVWGGWKEVVCTVCGPFCPEPWQGGSRRLMRPPSFEFQI